MATERVVEVDTETAAHVLGKSVGAFKMWASRNGVEPVRVQQVPGSRRGRGGTRRRAMWDLEQLHKEIDRDE